MEHPFDGYQITSPYGWRRLGSTSAFHPGIDLVKAHQAPIYAFTGGTILYAGLGKAGTGLNNYGNVVVVKDRNGRAQLYAHLDRVAVKAGAAIGKGQLIGYQGNTGDATGSHLHYEIRKKTAPLFGWESNQVLSTVEPTAYLQNFSPEDDPVTMTKYTVKAGDTLYGIAQKFNTSVDRIRAANNMTNENLIIVGQVLNIPSTHAPVSYTVKTGDTLYSIAQKFNTSVDDIRTANNLNSNLIQVGQVLVIPGANTPVYYTVKPGDHLLKIADAFNTTVEKLASMNNIRDPNLLQVGQTLRVK